MATNPFNRFSHGNACGLIDLLLHIGTRGKNSSKFKNLNLMFPNFGSTADTLSKASSVMFQIGTDAHLYDDPEDVNIAPLLYSRFDSEICEALKRLLALIAQGVDVSNFFPQVVKNVASQSLEVKKLVYLYLLHYAEKRPNEALLSINCFQKDLSDSNPLVRAWALRTMAGIRLHVISPLVVVAIGKCARDPSAYVRKCAANALPKLHDLHQEENAYALEEIVGVLLSDHSPGVVGSAAAAFISICPNNLSMIGRKFKRLCETLPDVEEWGQILLIGILLRYAVAVHGLVKESIMFSRQGSDTGEDVGDSVVESENDNSHAVGTSQVFYLTTSMSRCYIEGPDEYLSRESYLSMDASGLECAVFTSSSSNDDVKLLLQCTSPLLWSHNSSVVLAAAGVHWVMAPRENIERIVKPLLFLLRSFRDSQHVVLCNIQVFSKTIPSIFAPHYEDFFIYSSDSYQIKALKLDILSTIATDSSIPHIFQEFQDYIKDPDRRFVADTVAAFGLCAQRLPSVANKCLEGLLDLTRQEHLACDLESIDGEAGVLAQAIMSIKAIIKQDPISHEKVIIQLARSLDSIKVPAARAMIVWMIGEYNAVGEIIPRMLPTLLQYLAGCFTSEALDTKHQILIASVKVVLSARGEDSSTFIAIFNYVLQLAKCDINYDVRDRARFIEKILSSRMSSQSPEERTPHLPHNTDLHRILVEKIFSWTTQSASPAPNNFRLYLPGSLSQLVLHAAPGYEPLPKPGSLYGDLGWKTEDAKGINSGEITNSESSGTTDRDTLAGSVDEDNISSYGSRHSVTSSDESYGAGSGNEEDEGAGPLIQFSDGAIARDDPSVGTYENNMTSHSDNLGALMSKKALESWLDGQPGVPELGPCKQAPARNSLARISINDIHAKVKRQSYTLLDPTSGNGLKVDYSFLSEISSISPSLVCVEISFENRSTEPLAAIVLIDEEANQNIESDNRASETNESSLASNIVPRILPVEEITSLGPGQTITRTLQVHFQHHLLPLKLNICCNSKKLPVKLRPDIGYFVKPLEMDIKTFTNKESQLPGMFEYTRSCTFKDHIVEVNCEKDSLSMGDNLLVVCHALASKMLSNANLFLVSVDIPVAAKFDDASGLCLRFSGEILSNLIPCLITITAEGKCSAPLNISVKINCEETIFGLNLLNRIVAYLS